MMTKAPRVWSDLPIPPGEILAEELAARGLTRHELAARLGWSAPAVNDIIKAKQAITPDIATGLEQVLGIEAEFWTNLEADYRAANHSSGLAELVGGCATAVGAHRTAS